MKSKELSQEKHYVMKSMLAAIKVMRRNNELQREVIELREILFDVYEDVKVIKQERQNRARNTIQFTRR